MVEQDAGSYTLVLKNEQAELMEQVTLQLAVNGKQRVKQRKHLKAYEQF